MYGPYWSMAVLSGRCCCDSLAQTGAPPAPFLMWLGSMAQTSCPPLDYDSLLELFDCESIKSRLIRRDLMFARSIFSGRLDCTEIVGMFPLSVPSRRTRRPELFHVPRRVWKSERSAEGLPRSSSTTTELSYAEQPTDRRTPTVTFSDLRHCQIRRASRHLHLLVTYHTVLYVCPVSLTTFISYMPSRF